MGEDEVGVRPKTGTLTVGRELICQTSGKRNRSAGPPRLRRAELAAGESPAHPDEFVIPVNVKPANSHDLAPTHPSHCRRKKDETVDSPQGSRGSRGEDRLEFGDGQEAEVRIA